MAALSRTLPDGIRIATVTAVAGTVFIAGGAFWLSFTSLADLARRSGIDTGQAWAWPLIVDGIIVVATVAVVVLAGSPTVWYPWALLFAGASISVAANAIHAVLASDADVPAVLAAGVAAVPPLVLLAITHLTTVLVRHGTRRPPGDEPTAAHSVNLLTSAASRVDAVALRASGWSNIAIAERFGVHPSTVGRWLRGAVGAPSRQHEISEGGPSDG